MKEEIQGVTGEVLTAAMTQSQGMKWVDEFLILFRCTYDTIKDMAASELGDSCEQLLVIMRTFLHVVLAELTLYVHDLDHTPSFARKIQDAIMSSAELLDTFKKTSMRRKSKNRSGGDVFVTFVKDQLREKQRSSQMILTDLGYLEKFQISDCFNPAMKYMSPSTSDTPIVRFLLNNDNKYPHSRRETENFTANTRIKVMKDFTRWYNRKWDLSSQRIYVLHGSETTGKTAIAKEICKRFSDTLLCSYFVGKQNGFVSSKTFVLELARCLCTRLRGYRDRLPKSESFLNAIIIGDFNFAYQCLMADRLGTMKTFPKRMLIVIDGLHNFSECDQKSLVDFIRHFNEETPHWLYLLVSIRDIGFMYDNLNFHLMRRFNLGQKENNRDDILIYLAERAGERSESIRETTETIADLSGGSFVYAVHLAEKIQNGSINDVAMDENGETFLATFLPTSLDEMYHVDMVDLKSKLKGWDNFNRVMAPILVAREPLHSSILHLILKDDEFNCLVDMKSYFNLDPDRGTLDICHDYLLEWFESLGDDDECFVNFETGHSTLIGLCWPYIFHTGAQNGRYKVLHHYATDHILYHFDKQRNEMITTDFVCDIKYIASRLVRHSNTFQCWFELLTEISILQEILHKRFEECHLNEDERDPPKSEITLKLNQYYNFLVVEAPSLIRHPEMTFQYAHNSLTHPEVTLDAKQNIETMNGLKNGWLNMITTPFQTHNQRQNLFFKNKIRAVDISPDGTLLSCVTSNSGTDGEFDLKLHIVDAEGFSLIRTITLESEMSVQSSVTSIGLFYHCHFFHDGEHIFYGSLTHIATTNGDMIPYTLDGSEGYFCTSCDVSTKRKVLAIGLAPKSIAEEEDYCMANSVLHVYDIEKKNFIVSLDKYDGYITCISFDTYGQRFVFYSSGSRRICIWNLERMSMEITMPVPVKEAINIHFPLPNYVFIQTQEIHVQKLLRCDVIKEDVELVKSFSNNTPIATYADQRCVYVISCSNDPWICRNVAMYAFNSKTLTRDAKDTYETIPFLSISDKQTLRVKCSNNRLVFTAGMTLSSCNADVFLNNTFSELTQNYRPREVIYDSTFSDDNNVVVQRIDFCSGRVNVHVLERPFREIGHSLEDTPGRKQRGPIFSIPPVISANNSYVLIDGGCEFHGASDVRLWNKQTNEVTLLHTTITSQRNCPGSQMIEKVHQYRVTSFCFSNYDSNIIIGGKFTQLEFIDVFDADTLEHMKRYDDRGCFALPSKGNQSIIMSCSNDGSLFLWKLNEDDISSIQIIQNGYLNRDEFVPPVAFSDDCQRIIMLQISCESIRAHLINVKERQSQVLDEKEDTLYEFLYPYPFMTGFTPNANALATSLNSNIICLFNAQNGAHLKDINIPEGRIISGGWCTNRHLAVIASENEFTSLHIIDTRSECELNYIPLKGFTKLYFSSWPRQWYENNSQQPEYLAIVHGDLGVTLIRPEYRDTEVRQMRHSSAKSLVVRRSSRGSVLSMESIM